MKKYIIEKTREIIMEVLENVNITGEQYNVDLNELGMDSLAFIQMVVMLEEEFNIEFPDLKLQISEMNTLDKIVEIVCNEKLKE